MPRWTRTRAKKLTRRKNGTFKVWKGGKKKSELKVKRNSFQGIAIHIGYQFKKQFGKTAKVGDVVRTKTKDGSYHKQADWYVRTPHGWRDTGSNVKPSRSKINTVIKKSRSGRKHKK